ncbi:glycosyltransferase family 1 protein [Kaistia dalseonensis]|uniref:Glycosyltransferase involved in cell wall biosynthesis n=1 Tax=Kaistia dalseonensis TaxID=410840 RepID=A0ABU0H2U9_9HYPH|nr:glycosyltransferase family 1 protein [Kaistia dalseonensis]MCX5493545.1 glycosyltransferase family 1 protein [Kaistia dalseonensis]MDQ0436105.1 glycosyltransferase involved in cell wall biosynthesis [Kaistia dalseonensis]
MSRILIASDAWRPQINGVVRTLERLVRHLPEFGAEAIMLTPEGFPTVPCPTYPEIRLTVAVPGSIARRIEEVDPDHVHIATEGPIGFAVRRWCLRHGRIFTTSYHTRFPEYLAARIPVPVEWTYGFLRDFHNSGAGCMVATRSLQQELAARGFHHLMSWSRGVDAELFRPDRNRDVLDLPRPIYLYVGRVAVEKNIEAFLGLDLPGSKVVVGDGPALEMLKRDYPDATFLGSKVGEELADIYAASDCFVFPSRTDTFGVVMLEAMASGLPVAAFPVTGPLDVVGDTGAGVLDEDLRAAAIAALDIPRERCRAVALRNSWQAATRQFLDNISGVYQLSSVA